MNHQKLPETTKTRREQSGAIRHSQKPPETTKICRELLKAIWKSLANTWVNATESAMLYYCNIAAINARSSGSQYEYESNNDDNDKHKHD